MNAVDILTEAAAIVAGARNETHGEKESSFIAIGNMWSVYLASRKDPAGLIRPADVCQMMVLLKQCRAEWGTPMDDHWVDAAGYAAIAGELLDTTAVAR